MVTATVNATRQAKMQWRWKCEDRRDTIANQPQLQTAQRAKPPMLAHGALVCCRRCVSVAVAVPSFFIARQLGKESDFIDVSFL